MADTIFALSSGAGRAGVAVIRISGPHARTAFAALTARDVPAPRVATLVSFAHPDTGETIDRGLSIWFPAPFSYTGEDGIELHVHGGRAVVAALLSALTRCDGLRLAEPGEFTKRAFLAGKMDLTAAEGVIDLVEADTEAQRRQALRQAGGALARIYDGWRDDLIKVLAYAEAELEFPDEDVPTDVTESIRHHISPLLLQITQHLEDDRRGERLRDGVSVAIVGAPNAGKSSLLNLLAQRDAAIVSDTAGTTRDVIDVHLDLGGYPVILADTAGLREAQDEIEAEGVVRALARGAEADLLVHVIDATAPQPLMPALEGRRADVIEVWNKSDLTDGAQTDAGWLLLSAKTGAGMGAFLERLRLAVSQRFEGVGASVITRARHREALETCMLCLERAGDATLPELATEDLRLATRALGRVTGRVDVEEILDVVFRDFCIGK